MLDLNPQFPNNQNQKSNHNFNNHSNSRHRFNGGSNVQFRLETTEEEDSGVCSPPLWRKNNFSPPDSPARFTNPWALSPASRALAIARGKKEMMDMVENMPETSYELSLKDMVDQRREFLDNETRSMEEGEERSILHGGQTESQRWKKNKKGSVKRQESNKTGRVIVKNTSMNNNKGLLINMFFPFSIGSKKKSSIATSTSFGNNGNVKLSPKPELLLEKSGGGDRSDWWWKKFTGSGYSESLGITSSSRSGSSGSSGSSGRGSLRSNSGSKKNDCGYGCWSFFPSRKKKS